LSVKIGFTDEAIILRVPKEILAKMKDQGIVGSVPNSPGYLQTTKPVLVASIKELQKAEEVGVSTWIDSWRALFPSGKNFSGYPHRGDKQICKKKMEIFVKETKYTKDQIFKATKSYVDEFKSRDYEYMKQAHYFIGKKDSGSSLAAYCEMQADDSDNTGSNHVLI
jgi:hypothetical protein